MVTVKAWLRQALWRIGNYNRRALSLFTKCRHFVLCTISCKYSRLFLPLVLISCSIYSNQLAAVLTPEDTDRDWESRHGSRRGVRGAWPPWILKCLAKKGCFLSFEWEKNELHYIWAPSGKLWKKSHGGPHGNNPSDSHESSHWPSLQQR